MADRWALLDFVIDQELARVKRELMDTARSVAISGGTHEGTDIEVLVRVDLDAVLRSSASTSVVRQIQRDESEASDRTAEESWHEKQEGKEEEPVSSSTTPTPDSGESAPAGTKSTRVKTSGGGRSKKVSTLASSLGGEVPGQSPSS